MGTVKRNPARQELMGDQHTTVDAFLGGALRLRQPMHGHRAGVEPVLLAAYTPARAGESVLDAGTGTGAALLCLGWRVPGLALHGIELDPAMAALAQDNAALNRMQASVTVDNLLTLREGAYDHVLTNPPYHGPGTPAPDSGKALARQDAVGLDAWLHACLRRLKPAGTLTVVARADCLDAILSALQSRAGAMAVLPLYPRVGEPASLILVCAVKGRRTRLRLLPPLILHEENGDFTAAAQSVLRQGAALP